MNDSDLQALQEKLAFLEHALDEANEAIRELMSRVDSLERARNRQAEGQATNPATVPAVDDQTVRDAFKAMLEGGDSDAPAGRRGS